MTGNAINAKSESLELHELSSEQLDAVSGGFYDFGGYATLLRVIASQIEQGGGGGGGGGTTNDSTAMFNQLLQQMTQGG